jgi:CHASE2 domain-containing sensor protein
MDALNTLRAVLVGCAFVATILLAVEGMWVPVAVMSAGILAHFGLWWWLRVKKRREAAADPLHELTADR